MEQQYTNHGYQQPYQTPQSPVEQDMIHSNQEYENTWIEQEQYEYGPEPDVPEFDAEEIYPQHLQNQMAPSKPKAPKYPEYENPDAVKYRLSKPLHFEDYNISVLTMDFDSLTGRDLEEAVKDVPPEQQALGLIEVNKSYLASIVAKAAGVPIEVIRALTAKDYTAVTVQAQNFLL